MADLFAELNGVRIVSGRITIPFVGLWHADVRLDTTTTLPDAANGCTLKIAGLTLVGTKFRAADYQGSLRSRIVGGAGGWSNPLPGKFYKHDPGVRVSLVLTDAARELGERVVIDTDRVLGPRWYRIGVTRGSRLIRQVVGDGWYVSPDGVTRIGLRTGKAITSDYDVLNADGALGHFIVATDLPADFAPARIFSTPTLGPRTISCVSHVIEKGSLRSEVQT